MYYCDDEFRKIIGSLHQKLAVMSRTERAQMYMEIYLEIEEPGETTRELLYRLLRMMLPEAMEAEAFEEFFYTELDRLQEKRLAEHENTADSDNIMAEKLMT